MHRALLTLDRIMAVRLFDDQVPEMLQPGVGRSQSSGQDRQSDIDVDVDGM